MSPIKIKLDKRSKYLRKLILDCLIGGNRGHMGSAMSLVEILRVLYDKIAKTYPKKPLHKNRDRDKVRAGFLLLKKGRVQ